MSKEDTAPPGKPFRHPAHTYLLAAVRADDRSALEKLYLEYYPHLAHFLMYCITRWHIVKNAIDDAFVILWSQAKYLPPESDPFILIFELAYFEATRAHQIEKKWEVSRLRGESRVPLSDGVGVTPLQHGWSPLTDSFPLEQRATISLAYHLDCSVKEIAQIMRTTPQTVLSRICSARGHLRRARPLAGDALPYQSLVQKRSGGDIQISGERPPGQRD
jgi:RNA polymerase sigma-70 factor, ECF subfamily